MAASDPGSSRVEGSPPSYAEPTTDGVLEVDRQGRLRSVNGIAMALLGLHEPAAVLDHSLDEILPGPSGESLGRAVDECLRTGLATEVEMDPPQPSGSILARNLPSDTGATVHLTTVGVAPSRPREDAATEMLLAKPRRETADMEFQVAERTRELSEAMAVAVRSNQAKDDFLARLSHEMRTPLNAVLGYCQLLQFEKALDERLRGFVAHATAAARHLQALLDDVADLAQAESGSAQPRMEILPLAPMIDDCVRMVSADALAAEVRIAVDVPLHETAYADRTRLRQVLINLLSNAVKYNRAGGSVRVRAQRSPSDPTRVRIDVVDSGRGIERDRLHEVFEPFNRLGAEQGVIPGTGIGLTIALRLVQSMGGRIEVASIPDEGTRFRVELDADAAKVVPEPRADLCPCTPAVGDVPADAAFDALAKRWTPIGRDRGP